MEQEFCITFAGPIGCSKSPVAHQLSLAFNWPIFSPNAIRHEVLEDTLDPNLDDDLLDQRIVERATDIARRPGSFIYDASQDRHWDRFIASIAKTPSYAVGVISFDLSLEFYKQILAAKQYDSTLLRAKKLLESHEEFVAEHQDVIICSITDATFSDRLYVAQDAVRKFIDDKKGNIG